MLNLHINITHAVFPPIMVTGIFQNLTNNIRNIYYSNAIQFN